MRYFYDVSFDRKLRINEQSICKVCKLPNGSEQDAVGVMRDLLNCRDGIYDINYLNYDEITVIIDELCTNLYVLYYFFCIRFYIMLCSMLFLCIPCVILYSVYEIKVMVMLHDDSIRKHHTTLSCHLFVVHVVLY